MKKRQQAKNSSPLPAYIFIYYADNFFLPFCLLLAKIFLPDLVDILFLKPCSLALSVEMFFSLLQHLLCLIPAPISRLYSYHKNRHLKYYIDFLSDCQAFFTKFFIYFAFSNKSSSSFLLKWYLLSQNWQVSSASP